ncbi:carbohydrate ABC transporter permease [Leifsonia shinshuensis]|uniref:Carbohydrate ABC transporter permease n=1 Tax=Leifsonia shinshuensis TaxID=150026 RepID=A0A7G6YBB9_9MICO|nr:carbohydrate ABC transporter permease [Leifsonia shinshuensis]QNE35784.1 carbohydrate ABC transporter permease [Leifsonia shinshuensis]
MISRTERLLNHAILAFVTVLVLFPVIWFVFTALSPSRSGQLDLLNLHFDNFVTAWNVGGFGSAMIASAVITIGAVLGQTVLAILSGFAFGVLGVAGQKVLFPLILFGLMISAEVFIIPLYYTFQSLGLTNSWLGLIIIQIGMGVPFGVFWMRATFRAVPKSLIEAAEMDGARSWRMLWQILLPISRPAVLTLALLSFMWTWNDFFLSLVFIADPSIQPATLALGVFQGQHTLDVNMLAAGSLIVALPVLILYAFFQRHFIRGVLNGALKE